MDTEPSTEAVGTRILFENELIRVWDFTLEPGQASTLHRHIRDYFFVYVSDDNQLEVQVPGQTPKPVSTPDGYVSFTRVGTAESPDLTHRLVNVGAQRHRQILVELLEPPDGGRARTETNRLGRDGWAEGQGAPSPDDT